MLSSYTATLHQSDRALLQLLHSYETQSDVDMSPYHPLHWGPSALQRYNNNNAAAFKHAQCSNILALFDPHKMRMTCERFPASLALDPEAHVQDDLIEDNTIYDPRFVLTLLSHLLTSNIFIDKHLKFVEVGAINIAICSLSSKDQGEIKETFKFQENV